MKTGYIKLYRKLTDSRVFHNEGLLKVWIWCLLQANHEGAWVSIRSGRNVVEVWVNPGQFIFGRESAAKQLMMSPSTVWKRVKKLKTIGNCDIESNSKYSVITIINWTIYQSDEKKGDSKGDSRVTAKEQPGDTNKNDKNDKNEIYRGNGGQPPTRFEPPTMQEIKSYCHERHNQVDPEKFHDFYESKNWMIGKNKMKNWQAAVRTWEKHDSAQNQNPTYERLQ